MPPRPLLFSLLLVTVAAHAGDRSASLERPLAFDPWTGRGVSLGGVFFPEFNYQAAGGTSSTDPAELAVGHHDPDRQGITQQEIEFALGARFGKRVRLFANYGAKVDTENRWVEEFEEHYAEIAGLPFDITLKGGRFYTRMGYNNSEHQHSNSFVDKYLATGRLIGEDSATVYGGEISMPVLGRALPVGWSDRLTFSLGNVPDGDEEHEHGGEEEESRFHGEEAGWQDQLATLNYTLRYAPKKAVVYEGGVSAAWGDNNFDRSTQLYGAHFQYLWNPNGESCADGCCLRQTGEFFRWRTEVFVRHFGASGEVEEEVEGSVVVPGEPAVTIAKNEIIGVRQVGIGGAFAPIFRRVTAIDRPATPPTRVRTTTTRQRSVRDDFTDAGAYTAISYGFPNGHVQLHLRGEYVSGIADAGLSERYRVSPAITLIPSERLPFHFKLQYNYDHLPASGDEHSVWAQFSLTWGDCGAHTH